MALDGVADGLLAAAARGLLSAGVVALVGAGAFDGWVAPELAELHPWYPRLLTVLGAVACATATLLAPLQVAQQMGERPLDVLPDYLLRTRQGLVLLTRLLVLAALAGWSGAGPSKHPVRRWVRTGLATALLVSVGLTGHAGARFDLLLSHLVHAGAVSLWGGALLALALCPGWRPGGEAEPALVFRAVQRLSRLAGVAFPVLAVAGAYLATVLTGGLAGLPASGYGRWLLIKLHVVAAVAAIAAINRWWLLPSAGSLSPRALGRLRRAVRVETAVLLGILALTGVLSTQPPPAAFRP